VGYKETDFYFSNIFMHRSRVEERGYLFFRSLHASGIFIGVYCCNRGWREERKSEERKDPDGT